jgi:hypothetical protein
MVATCRLQLGVLAVAAMASWPGVGNADADCRAASPDYTLALLELYTSEGCDSCPPADHWFSAVDLGPPATRVAAVAFHVDYWDRLGWHDRFGNADFTSRQNDEVRRHRAAGVYTPQVVLQGSELAAWRNISQPTAALAAINARPARASIELTAAPVNGASVAVDVHVRVPAAPDREHAEVAVVLVQNGLASYVKAGENKGKHLAHDHVVRSWRLGLPVGANGELRQRVTLPVPDDVGAMQFVAWVEDTASGEVLQALTLPLCDK